LLYYRPLSGLAGSFLEKAFIMIANIIYNFFDDAVKFFFLRIAAHFSD
jgi:hypothetical protein